MKQPKTEQLLVQKAFHNPTSRVYNSCKNIPKGIWIERVVRARTCTTERGRERERRGEGGGGICENDIRLFRQNELYYCIQP